MTPAIQIRVPGRINPCFTVELIPVAVDLDDVTVELQAMVDAFPRTIVYPWEFLYGEDTYN